MAEKGQRKLTFSVTLPDFHDRKPLFELYLIPLLIFVVAFLLRVMWIGTYAGQDEVYYVGYASDLLHGKSFANVFPPLFEMIVLPVLALTGENLVIVHIFIAFLGGLTVLFVYLIGQKFFSAWVGIIAALLLMLNTTHWFFSAFGMLDVPAVLFATSAIYFLWSGYVERNSKMLLIGSLLNVAAVFTRYTFFPAAAFMGYLLLFDRPNFKKGLWVILAVALFWILIAIAMFGSIFNISAVFAAPSLTSIGLIGGFAISLVLLLYVIVFKREKLSQGRLMFYILLPLIAWGIWMIYFTTQVSWLWNWWLQYVTGQLSINIPWYNYFQAVHYEFLGPLLTYFTIFASLFLLAARHTKINRTALAVIFLFLFVGTAYFYGNYPFDPLTQAAIGFAALALPMIYFFNLSDIRRIAGRPLPRPDFNKFLVFLIAAVFLFYSPLGVKFPRYVMSALPAIYLLVGEIAMETKGLNFGLKSRYPKYLFVAAAVAVLVIFAFANAQDTINKLVVDKVINDVKHTAQKYVNDNSPQCSTIYSKTWYGFYYLRNRITDLPADVNTLKGIIKANCQCPPQFFAVEGSFDPKFLSVATLDKSFHQDSVNYRLTWQGIQTQPAPIAPVDIYKINNNVITSQCA